MKFLKNATIWSVALLIVGACSAKQTSNKTVEKLTQQQKAELETAYFAEGCFWCAEEVFQRVKGVKDAVSGYSGGKEENPTYHQVGSGSTGHAESIMVYYDPEVVSYRQLVQVFFGSQDPTQANGQGPDIGSQYRSAIFYQTDEEKKIAEEVMAQVAKEYDKPLAVEITKFDAFYEAEDYHQEYFTNHPNDSYIVHESTPRVERFMKKFPELLKDRYKN